MPTVRNVSDVDIDVPAYDLRLAAGATGEVTAEQATELENTEHPYLKLVAEGDEGHATGAWIPGPESKPKPRSKK